ncbi:GON-4-like protein [Saccostrea echinata]|uniref:GON-4-like protein n=1 Tax=Saccostrea echinata TaxID=191078 RepID=UPI002A7FF8DC|nr:GON-4-like protein [Saccostrea echinata]
MENNMNNEGNKLQGPSKEKRKFDTLNIIKNIFPFKSLEKSVPATRGIKRSQGKPNLIRSCKRKKLTLGKKDSKTADGGEGEEEADNECSDDSDSEGWQILEEESDKDLDKALEENASRNKLTAYNVKAILHQVITNEHVVAMVKNTILNEVASKEELKEATYEPKMTRATVKKAIEEKGDVMHPWPLTPLKKKTEEVRTILDIELSEEEEEDDDYSPDKEKEGSFSDEDSESVTSSQMSDFGSPCPSTPATPRTPVSSVGLTLDTRNATTTEKEYKGPFLSPMGPPSKLPLYRQSLNKKFQEVEDMSEKTKEEQTIAARTRSKLSLEDTSIIELESTFVPPDFTPDMYDNECEDEDWQGFLQSLYKPPESENTNDGMDDEDPEYNYLAEIDDLIDSDEELRNDRAVKISKKEMNTLMDELFEYYQETQPLEEDEKKAMKVKAKAHYKRQVLETDSQPQSTENQFYVISDHEREQIADQMRKHVQLLTQMYVSAMGNQAEYKEVADYSKNLLMELHQFSVTNTQYLTPSSMYNATNLKEAVKLVNKTEEWEQIERNKHNRSTQYISSEKSIASLLVQNYHTLSKRKKDLILNIVGDTPSKAIGERLQSNRLTIPHFTNQQKQLIWTSPVFMYPELVPSGSFLFRGDLQETKRRVAFTESEDRLMALGLDQFKHLPYFHQLIRKFLLPCKTEEQIRVRIKNLTSSKASPNIIKNYKLTKKLPDFQTFTGIFSPNDMKAPKDQDTGKLPTWCKELKIREIMANTEDAHEKYGNMQRSSSVNIPLMSSEKGKAEDSKSCSAPVTPMTKTQDQNKPCTVIIVPNLTPEKSNVSQRPVTPVIETKASQSSLPLNAIVLTNIPVSSACDAEIPFSTKTLGIPLSCSQMSADQNFTSNMLASQRNHNNSSSLSSECSQKVLPLNTSSSVILPVSSTHSLNTLCTGVTPVPVFSNQTVSAPNLPIQTQSSQTVTGPTLSNQAVISSSCQSMASLIEQKCQVSETLNKKLWTPTPQNSALLSNPCEHIQEEFHSSTGMSIQSERCISPDNIEPTVKMKNKERDSNETDLSKEVIKKQMSIKGSDARSESPSRLKKVPFSPGFIPLHQESGQTEILGNPGSPILIRMVENVPSPVESKSNQPTEGSTNQNASVGEHDMNAENRGNKERQSNVGNVFFGDSNLTDSGVVQTDVSDSSLNTTLVADNSYNESPKPVENSREIQALVISSVNALNSVNQSTNVQQTSGKTVTSTHQIITQHHHENYNSAKLLGIPIENKLHVNQLPSTNRTEEQESDKNKTSCRAHLIGSLSSLSSTQSKPLVSASPMKSALDIVAAYSSLMLSPKKGPASFVQKAQETTPVKSRYRPLAPKPYTSSATVVSPFLSPQKSPRKSPRRQQLQRKARAICPKGLVVKTVISPSKKAASQIMNRVLGKTHCKILPRPPGLPRNELHIQTKGLASHEVPAELLKDETETEEEGMETASECDTVESEYLSDEVMEDVGDKKRSARKNLQKKFHKNRELRNSVESDDTEVDESNLYDSQDDNEEESEHIADLMAASTTIKFNPKSILSKDSKDLSSKTKRRKDSALAMLAPDIVETDPLKDDRDTAFAQAYLTKAAEDLKDDFTTYEQFLKILYEFGKSEQSPVKLYREMRELLRNFPDLVEDFSAFLSPSQALECGCFMENLRFRRARTFLRKLEVYAERHPSHYQKTMKLLTKWAPGGSKEEEKALKETLEQVLKNQPHLLDELSLFFEDEKPPDSYMTEFEEITLGDSDEEEGFQFDDFEEVVVPEDENPDGTKKCMCNCHQNPNAKNFHMRNIHCTNCCLKVIDGELYYRINRQVLKKVRVRYHPEVKPKPSCPEEEDVEEKMKVKTEPMTPAQWEEDEEGAEKENVQIRRPKHVGIKLKISSRKKGKQGRFFSIKEMADSPVKKTVTSVSTETGDQISDLENLPSTSNQSKEMPEEGEKSGERESTSSLRTEELESMEHSEESQLGCGLPDLIPPQDQRRQEEANPGGVVEKIEETSPLSKVPRSVEVTVTADSNEDFAGAIISIPNTETTPKKDSNREFTISSWVESANLSPQKTPPTLTEEVAMDGHISHRDSSCSDLLAKALHEAMISQSDVSMTLDSSHVGNKTQSASSPTKAPVSSTNLGFSIVSEKETRNMTQNVNKLDSEQNISPSAKKLDSSPTDKQKKCEKRRIVPKPVTEDTSCVSPAFSLSSIDNVEFLKSPTDSSPIIAYTNSPVFHNENSNLSIKVSPNPKSYSTEESGSSAGQGLRLKLSKSQSVASPSRNIISSVVGFGQEELKAGPSPTQVSDALVDQRETTPATPLIEWTREMDRVMLESVKANGPFSKTFEDIAKQIPGSTVASIIERFHALLEMLADETPSEDDTTEETTESSS